ncbi:MAG: hypothetical protein PVI59_11125 [Anaerolineae bacterium]
MCRCSAISFVAKVLFATITNANFDPDRREGLIREAVKRGEALKAEAQAACRKRHGAGCSADLPEMAAWVPTYYGDS